MSQRVSCEECAVSSIARLTAVVDRRWLRFLQAVERLPGEEVGRYGGSVKLGTSGCAVVASSGRARDSLRVEDYCCADKEIGERKLVLIGSRMLVLQLDWRLDLKC